MKESSGDETRFHTGTLFFPLPTLTRSESHRKLHRGGQTGHRRVEGAGRNDNIKRTRERNVMSMDNLLQVSAQLGL